MKKTSKSIIGIFILVVVITAFTLSSCKDQPVRFSQMLGVDLEKDPIVRVDFSRRMGNGETFTIIDLDSVSPNEILAKFDTIEFKKAKEEKGKHIEPSTLRVRFFLEMKPIQKELDKAKKDKNYDPYKALYDKHILSEEELSHCKYIEYNYDFGFKKVNKPHAKTKEGYYKASKNIDKILEELARSYI